MWKWKLNMLWLHKCCSSSKPTAEWELLQKKSCWPGWTRRSSSVLKKKERKRVNSNIYKTHKADRNYYIDQNVENNISICLHLGLNFKMFTYFWGVDVPNVHYLFAICKEEKFYSFLGGKLCARNILHACPVSVEKEHVIFFSDTQSKSYKSQD